MAPSNYKPEQQQPRVVIDIHVCKRMGSRIDGNVEFRLAWPALRVPSFAEMCQHPLIRLRGLKNLRATRWSKARLVSTYGEFCFT